MSNLDDSVVCHGGVEELAMSLLSIPTYYKRPGQDPADAHQFFVDEFLKLIINNHQLN